MVEDVGLHPLQPADLVDNPPVVRQQLAERHAALTVAIELAGGAEQRLIPLQKGEPLAREHAFRRLLAGQLAQLGLVVEQLQLGRSAGHEQIDHALGLGRVMRRPLGQGIGRIEGHRRIGQAVLGEQALQCDGPQPDAALAEEVAPRDVARLACGQFRLFALLAHGGVARGGYSRTMKLSVFSTARATAIKAAAAAASSAESADCPWPAEAISLAAPAGSRAYSARWPR